MTDNSLTLFLVFMIVIGLTVVAISMGGIVPTPWKFVTSFGGGMLVGTGAMNLYFDLKSRR